MNIYYSDTNISRIIENIMLQMNNCILQMILRYVVSFFNPIAFPINSMFPSNPIVCIFTVYFDGLIRRLEVLCQ